MFCLTLHREHAEAIANGSKYVENRSWGKNSNGSLRKGLDRTIGIHRGGKGGAIIATAKVAMILTPEQALKYFPEQKQHIGGPQCWILSEVKRIKPIFCAGNQGLWEINLTTSDIEYLD